MEKELRTIGLDSNSSAIDFVTAYDREEMGQDLVQCARCGLSNKGAGICSVNLKHVAVHADIYRNGYRSALILEDDISLDGGAKGFGPFEKDHGMTAWPGPRMFLPSLLSIIEEANAKWGQPQVSSDNGASQNTTAVGRWSRGTIGGAGRNIVGGFDTIILGECANYLRQAIKKRYLTNMTAHLFQPSFDQGASKCVGALLVSQRGSQRYLQALPFSKEGNYYASGKCYAGEFEE